MRHIFFALFMGAGLVAGAAIAAPLDHPEIREQLVVARAADLVRKSCPQAFRLNTLRALGEARRLETEIGTLGYGAPEAREALRRKDDRRAIYAEADALLARLGADGGDHLEYCAAGTRLRAESALARRLISPI